MDSSPLRIRVPSNPRCALFLLKPGAALTRAIRTVSPFSACALQLLLLLLLLLPTLLRSANFTCDRLGMEEASNGAQSSSLCSRESSAAIRASRCASCRCSSCTLRDISIALAGWLINQISHGLEQES